MAFSTAPTSNQVHFPKLNIRCGFSHLNSYLRSAVPWILDADLTDSSYPPKNECHHQAGFGIGKDTAARPRWLVAQELTQAFTWRKIDNQGFAMVGFFSCLGSTSSALSLLAKERGLARREPPQQSHWYRWPLKSPRVDFTALNLSISSHCHQSNLSSKPWVISLTLPSPFGWQCSGQFTFLQRQCHQEDCHQVQPLHLGPATPALNAVVAWWTCWYLFWLRWHPLSTPHAKLKGK